MFQSVEFGVLWGVMASCWFAGCITTNKKKGYVNGGASLIRNWYVTRFTFTDLEYINQLTSGKDFEIIYSQKGNPKLLHLGYDYVRNNHRLKSTSNWRCRNYWATRCKASCIVDMKGNLNVKGIHNHKPFQFEKFWLRYFYHIKFCSLNLFWIK